jgi:toxin-antitoxin system PIN domain toxin
MFVVDTNILIYAADRDAPEHAQCRKLLEAWRAQTSPWYVSWSIVYEFLRVTTHPNVLRKAFTLKEAWGFIAAVLASPNIGVLIETERHRRAAEETIASLPTVSGNLVFDLRIAILMREHGIKSIYTRDADFHRFPFLEVIDPVQG